MKRLVLFFFLSIFLFCGCLWAEEEIVLALDEAIAIALRDNRDILLKSADVKKAKAKIAEAKADLFPSITFSGSWTKTRGYYNKDISQSSAQVSLKQYLYTGGKTINTIRYNEYGFVIAQAVLDKTKLEIITSVKKAFYTFLLAREFSLLNKQILDNAVSHLNMTEARYQNGEASHLDILSIKDSLINVEEAYESSLNQAEASVSLLKNLLYLDKEVKITLEEQLNYEPREVAYDEAFLQAMTARPEIRQYEAQANAAKKAIEIAKAGSRPTVYASWDYYSRSHVAGLSGLSKNWNDYNVIGLNFSWPIFDGWATKHKVEQAIVDLKQAQLMKEKTASDIALELKNAYLSLKDGIAKIRTAESELKFYQDNLSVAMQKYQEGVLSSLDLEDANLSHRVALFNQKQAIYDYLIAKSDFDKATGGL